ncbi:hypothetical protein GGR22_002997 [Flavobacterium gossypii]|uniref:DUF1801 domain-containing protein n=1 Tax=Flavobacterium gossypii TaxID=1646119 RepID=A0ABR6DTQ6_9FLAO|nr:DUF1801 domain-containing protein [Flavobacterium gossypii]MBA9074824.1 hypothetical protein [Flavobacterium gossypii]
MNTKEQIKTYIESQEEPKRADMQMLHQHMLQLLPNSKLWFLDGTDATGKVIANPNIGYGQFMMCHKDGSFKEFYQIGISANTTGISVYIMGLEDKTYLPNNFGATIGKTTVTGYCIKFKSLKDINIDVLDEAIRYGLSKQIELT